MFLIPILIAVLFYLVFSFIKLQSQKSLIEQQLKSILPEKYHYLAKRATHTTSVAEMSSCFTQIQMGLYFDESEKRIKKLFKLT
jgi:hypothetical protein